MIEERSATLTTQDAVALNDHGRVVLIFADRVTENQREILRPHLLRALDGTPDRVRVLALPAGAVPAMIHAPFLTMTTETIAVPFPRCCADCSTEPLPRMAM